MVNAAATHPRSERRERTRAVAAEPASLGVVNLNPFGDLHTLQHLSARLAKALRPVFDPLVRAETRIWAEPLLVQRFADYRTECGDAQRIWVALPTGNDAPAQLAFDFTFVLTLLDLDPNIVKPGWTPLLITILLGAAIVLLYFSLRKQFRKIDKTFPMPEAPATDATATPSEPAAPKA